MRQIGCGDSQKKRDGGDRFKINQALQADSSDFFQVAVGGDAGDESSENQGSDDHFDQAKENVAEYAQVYRKLGAIDSQFKAREHREDYPERERAAAHASNCQHEQAGAAQDRERDVSGEEKRGQGSGGEEQQSREEQQVAGHRRIFRQGSGLSGAALKASGDIVARP